MKSKFPKEHAAFELAIKYGKEIDADILLGTDPYADRHDVAVSEGQCEGVIRHPDGCLNA
ncbi:hypothetical protein [Cytobacillus firmus]|uniref:hypothetical protein n=1 Tax=Cytobacillus firmus TaxID=1399 RepID=UPI0022284C5F|nr:hypothetical protein [Cytobacillus firmus]